MSMDGGGGQTEDREYRDYTEPMTLISKVHIDPKGKSSYVELDDGTKLAGCLALGLTHVAGKAPEGLLTFSLLDVKIV